MSAQQTPHLTPVTELSELQALQKLYQNNWPRHCVGYYWLDNYISWLKQEPNLPHLTVYTVNDDWLENDGLFIIIHRYQLYFSTLRSKDNQLLIKALNLLNWHNGFKISSIHEYHREALYKVLDEHQLPHEPDKPAAMHYLKCEEALKLEVNCPNGFYLMPVRVSDAAMIDAAWSARHPGSLKLITLLIEKNISVGCYETETDKLAAWCLRLQGGFLGALEVEDSYKRRGLGLLVASAISKRIAKELGHDIMALVNLGNKPACALFEKLGFVATGESYSWLRSFPTKKGKPWPENE